MMIVKGVAASPGIAMGPAYLLQDEEIIINRREIPKHLIRLELKRFKQALADTHRDLDAVENRVLKYLGKDHAKLIETHRLILRDPLITKDVPRRMERELVNAEFALSEALEEVNRAFEKIKDEFFRERRHDLFDVGKRLLNHLMRQEKKSMEDLKGKVILIAHNLLPSDTFNLKDTPVIGFATDLGGKTSHTAILAHSMRLPAVVGLSDISRRVRPGDFVILDGEKGLVIINPTMETLEKYHMAQARTMQKERELESLIGRPARTSDGKDFKLMANLDTKEELKTVVSLAADGIGLLRTEMLYLNRDAPPSEEEEYGFYKEVVRSLSPQPVVIRTADIGGDRLANLGVVEMDQEANPFLGLRGIRVFLKYPELFKSQVRAILRASAHGNVKMLIPMISGIGELDASKRLIEEAKQELRNEDVPFGGSIELGIMVEVPSTVLLLDEFLDRVDFVSIGTNDLIQYLLAVDRINEHVGHLYDPFHPAVVRCLHQIVSAVHRKNKWVSVCGEVTSDPQATLLLVGLGIDLFSVTPRMLLRIKKEILSLDHQDARKRVEEALRLCDPSAIRQKLCP